MRVDEVVAALRRAEANRREAERLLRQNAPLEQALARLSREEREILRRTVAQPRLGAVDRLCQELDIEPATVYRRRNKALKKLGQML